MRLSVCKIISNKILLGRKTSYCAFVKDHVIDALGIRSDNLTTSKIMVKTFPKEVRFIPPLLHPFTIYG